ncbi:MAG: type IV toxin-antitoxin system AbiEi family antitoxin domain-containing protein [Anaerolineales bacterium]
MSQEKYAKTQGTQLLETILEEIGPIFKVDQVRSIATGQGMNSQDLRWTLHSLSRSGWIARLKRGVYAVQSSLFPDELHPFALASALVEPMAISHWSALSHHGLTTQIPPMVQAMTPKKVVTPGMRAGETSRPRGRAVWEVLGIEVEFIYIEKKRFFGFQQEWVSRWNRVSITDRERTFLDMVARPDLFGGTELALATFQEHGDEFDLKKLMSYALRYDMGSVIKRLGWVLDEMGVESEIIKPLQEYEVQTYYLLDPSRPRKGSSDPRWQITNNLTG